MVVALKDGLCFDQPAWRNSAVDLAEIARTEAENTARATPPPVLGYDTRYLPTVWAAEHLLTLRGAWNATDDVEAHRSLLKEDRPRPRRLAHHAGSNA